MPSPLFISDPGESVLPLHLASEAGLPALRAGLAEAQQRWLDAQQFKAERGRCLLLPDAQGAAVGAVAGLGPVASIDALGPWDAALLADRLPAGHYALQSIPAAGAATLIALGWLLGASKPEKIGAAPASQPAPRLRVPAGADYAFAGHAATALLRARELINRPANLLGPAELAEAIVAVASASGGEAGIVMGEALQREYPLVHAVGMGSARAPRLVDARWPRAGAPRVVIVGKGVCFDSGGLDIKPSAGMLLMKKDMGGAACALALAELLCAMQAPLDLRLLVPCVENSVSGTAFRPGDVFASRKGLRVEIGNTDAEGRLILADALAAADESRPELVIDLATLTGAARTALGPELPALFGSDEQQVRKLGELGAACHDPLWPLPLWSGYDDELTSRVADLNNVSAGPFAGAITAALFLRRFVTQSKSWLHVDLYAWNPKDRPGRPLGGEPQAVRALYAFLRQQFG